MSKNIKTISQTEVELELTTSWQDVQKKYNAELDKIVKTASIPGFRKGKAPIHLVEKKLGDGFLQEIAANAMDDSLKVAIEGLEEKEKPLPYSTTALQNEDKVFPVKKGEDIKFSVRYEVMPEFDVNNYKGVKIEYPNVVVSADMVDNEIKKVLEQNAIIKDKDTPIANTDLVTVDYNIREVPKSERKDYTFTVGNHSTYYDFDDEIIGCKKGDKKTIEKHYTDENKPVGSDLKDVTIDVTITRVRSKELPALDDEFAQDVNQNFKTVQDFKDAIKKDIQGHLDASLKETKMSLLMDKLIPEVKLDVPKCMVDFEVANTLKRFGSQFGMNEADTIKFITSNGQSLEEFTSPWRADAEKTIKSQLIINKIKDKEQISATDEEVNAELEKQLKGVEEANKDLYKDMIKDNLLYQKAIDFILDNNKFEKEAKEITYEQFISGEYKDNTQEKKENK